MESFISLLLHVVISNLELRFRMITISRVMGPCKNVIVGVISAEVCFGGLSGREADL